MTIWRPDLDAFPGPRHRALASAIAAAIADGSLGPGSRLPPQRDLARVLGLATGTVTRAYKSSIARGLISGEVGRGTFVRGPAMSAEDTLWGPGRREDGPISFVMNLPPAGAAGAVLAGTLRAIADEGNPGFLLDHHSTGQIEAHLRSASRWLSRIGLEAPPDRVVMTNGAQHALLATMMALTRPGDVILAERLTYPPVRQMAHHLGLKLCAVDLDDEGLIPEALAAACRRTSARMLYCMPTLQSPTGATMTSERRTAIADIARRHDLIVVEDDVFGFLPEERPAPLARFAPERTVFVTSASKCMAPGLRVGMILAPPNIHDALRNAIQISCWMPAPLTTEIVHRWVDDGTAERLNAWLRQEMSARLTIAREVLGGAIKGQPGLRFHLWLELPEGTRDDTFEAATEAKGVKLAKGSLFRLDPGGPTDGVRLALGYETNRDRFERGLRVIAAALAGRPAQSVVV